MEMISWNIFEITTTSTPIHGVMLRGRLRKLSIDQKFLLLTENATDKENCVRFAVSSMEDAQKVIVYLQSLIEDVHITEIAKNVPNPVLSKMKVNDESRYTL
ncbi:MAG: hypothetical protein COU71_02955 [Parcubacteria group bacterium CG10_big_fil_rev_8_21_14_0_10_38_31]|nr:MAG: hypothetical protein COU71_02955 [Parcubacteria group bacterium CG10_big_fil_rev_8_21_14_0_10_38_31]